MHLYQHGMDLTLVSQWLGHTNIETTLIYAHADTEHKRQAITQALGDSAAPGVVPEKYTVLMKKCCSAYMVYNLRPLLYRVFPLLGGLSRGTGII